MLAFYVDDIIVNLEDSQEGCHIGDMYPGCVIYSDDLLLLSSSLNVLQRMVNICVIEADYLYIIVHEV